VEHQIWPEPAPPEPYTGPDRRKRMPVLGMRLRDFDVAQAADYMLSTQRTQQEGVGLFVTPNIQHIALARDDVEFATAMKSAQIIVADGFPVYRFAKARGLYLPGRITGREVIEDMFSRPERLAGHRGYFVVDSEETATRVEAWTAQAFPGLAVHTHVPPFGFEHDVEASTALAIDINAFETSLLFMCVGAPKSEVFVHRHRALLPLLGAVCGAEFSPAGGDEHAPARHHRAAQSGMAVAHRHGAGADDPPLCALDDRLFAFRGRRFAVEPQAPGPTHQHPERGRPVKDQIRAILDEVGGLACPAVDVGDRDDLFVKGLSSFATVGVMLAIEEEFDVSFPDSLLVRATFTSVDALAAAIASLKGQSVAA
jgi:N-acetylglucosaminyldiphosphoundecaprenol N-acetyl-beta-D-mannosaminyltransferase